MEKGKQDFLTVSLAASYRALYSVCCLGILNFHQYNFLTVAVDTVSLRRAQVCDSGWVTAAMSVQMTPTSHRHSQHWVSKSLKG